MNTTNKQTEHTPGPWQVETERGILDITAAGAGNIAMVSRSQLAGDSDANARLIAAAPSLLEACAALLECDTPTEDMGGDWGTSEWCEWVGQAIEKARAVIAQAKGTK